MHRISTSTSGMKKRERLYLKTIRLRRRYHQQCFNRMESDAPRRSNEYQSYLSREGKLCHRLMMLGTKLDRVMPFMEFWARVEKEPLITYRRRVR